MKNLILCEMRLGIVQFDWTFIFQIMNTVLWIVIIYGIYTYFKRVKLKRADLEQRVMDLERKLDEVEKKNE